MSVGFLCRLALLAKTFPKKVSPDFCIKSLASPVKSLDRSTRAHRAERSDWVNGDLAGT